MGEEDNNQLLILSDRLAGPDRLPIPSMLAVGAVHQHLLKTQQVGGWVGGWVGEHLCSQARLYLPESISHLNTPTHPFTHLNTQRPRVGLFVECGDAREVHDMATLLGYGADGICPYVGYEGKPFFSSSPLPLSLPLTLLLIVQNIFSTAFFSSTHPPTSLPNSPLQNERRRPRPCPCPDVVQERRASLLLP